MVTDAILTWIMDLLSGIQADWTSPDMPGFSLGFITDLNYFLPIGEMFSLFVLFVALGGPMAATSLVIWVLVGVLRGGNNKA